MATKNKETNRSRERASSGTTFGMALLGLLPGAGSLIGLRGDSEEKRAIGDAMPDGTVCAGISTKTGRPIFAAAADEPLTMIFSKAIKAARQSRAHGHHDWRVPDENELDTLQQNRNRGAFKDTFNQTGPTIAGCYWSSTWDVNLGAISQRFDNGGRGWNSESYRSSVRLVRG